MKKIVISIISISLSVCLSSCSNQTDSYSIKSKETNVITSLSNSYENGCIYMNNGVCEFYDYSSDTAVPLCLKPNCTHDSKDCISKAIASYASGTQKSGIQNTVIYNDNIYYFDEEEGIEGEGKDTTYNITSTLNKCNLKTGEIEKVIEISDLDCTSSVSMVLSDGTIYFIASNSAYQFEDGTWLDAGFGKQYLCSVDLESESFENYGLINDNEYASNNVIITESTINAVSDQVIISGLYNGKVYMFYSYVEDKNIIINAIENDDCDNIDWEYEVKEFDLDTKSIEITNKSQPICLDSNWYVTEDKANKKIVAENKDGNTIEFDSVNEFLFECDQYSIYNDKIWDLYNGVVYDITAKESKEISEDFLGENVTDYISDEDKYVVCSYDNQGNLLYSKVDEGTLTVK